ncbi:hypothetical protein [Sphingomonas antarctica]|uniref:hypothetical protein n=1 Tax=Sphingomonas antarctica TaxID=2040274 RepID=UPI0039ED11A4
MADAPTVLIVEDEPLVLEIASEEFEEAGCLVVRALNADIAVAVLKSAQRLDLL